MPAPQVIITPDASTAQLAEAVMEIQRILTRGIGLGDAADGTTYIRRTLPAPVRPETRVGASDNLFGSLIEVTIDLDGGTADLNVNLTISHNLNLPAPSPRPGAFQRLNVRWWVVGVRYNTSNYAALNAALPDQRVLVAYADGAVTENSIGLRFYTSLPSGAHIGEKLVVTLFFVPASG